MKNTLHEQQGLFPDNDNSTPENNRNDKIDIKYFKSLLPIKVTPVYDTYWIFAHKRQEIFFKRFHDKKYPWTDDTILNKYKFTNAYRASDRVSQYLIKKVIYSGPQDALNIFFRTVLFKIFNKIETWELLKKEIGEIVFQNYSYDKFNSVLNKAINNKVRIYSAAYIMPTFKVNKNLKRKHSNHLKLLETMIADSVHEKIANAKKFQDVFDILLSYPTIGKFLGYQYSIDLNYSELINFSENDFVIPGPGALNGISKCFIDTGGLTEIELIKFMKDRQEIEFDRLGLKYISLWGRPLSLTDCQNLFCEVDKYSRIAHPEFIGNNSRTRIKQKFKPNLKMISYWYPPKWGINDRIKSRTKYI